jgi:hypothetical protein
MDWLKEGLRHPLVIALISGVIGSVVGAIVGYLIALPQAPREIRELIVREAELAARAPRSDGVVAEYRELFEGNASIVDYGTGTPWNGVNEIERRFRQLERFATLTHRLIGNPIMDTTGLGATAVTTSNFTLASGENHVGYERWIFNKQGGQWKISLLQYNLPATHAE